MALAGAVLAGAVLVWPGGLVSGQDRQPPCQASRTGPATPGAVYEASATLPGGLGATGATLTLVMLDDALNVVGEPRATEVTVGVGGGRGSVGVTAPPGASYYQAILRIRTATCSPDLFTGFQVSKTADPPPTPSPTPVVATPVVPRPPEPSPAESPVSGPPEPNPGDGTTATAPAAPIGPALANGGFEAVAGDAFVAWEKQGGTLGTNGPASSGERGVLLVSTSSSTKWLYQAVTVEGGGWYEASVQARVVAGEGAAFVRIAWYASGDGSGRQLRTVSGAAVTDRAWTAIGVGPVRAPGDARSAVVRLMFQPGSGGTAAVGFDDAWFGIAQAPTPTPTPTPTPNTDPYAHTNSHADAHSHADANSHTDADADADPDSHTDANSHADPDTHADSRPHADPYAHTDANSHTDTHADTHADTDSHSHPDTNPHGDIDSYINARVDADFLAHGRNDAGAHSASGLDGDCDGWSGGTAGGGGRWGAVAATVGGAGGPGRAWGRRRLRVGGVGEHGGGGCEHGGVVDRGRELA